MGKFDVWVSLFIFMIMIIIILSDTIITDNGYRAWIARLRRTRCYSMATCIRISGIFMFMSLFENTHMLFLESK